MFGKAASLEAKSVEESSPESKYPANLHTSREPKKPNRQPFQWMIKPCYVYEEEYEDCQSLHDRFNQYFIFGEMRDCSQWNEDYNNCNMWQDQKDKEALEKLITSEKNRVCTRLENHYNNDVWENRESPPDDWNKELPPAITKHYEGSYLQTVKNRGKSEKTASLNENEHEISCCVM